MHRPQAWNLALFVGMLTWVGMACGARAPVVDGWPIGAVLDCSGDSIELCDRFAKAAADALDHRDAGHADVVRLVLHEEAQGVDALDNPILVIRSVALRVARFELADGTVRTIGVGDSPGGIVTVDRGP